MKKGKLLILGLLIGFGIGFYTKFIFVKNEGWDTFDSNKWKPIESGLYGQNYRKKMVFDLANNVLKNGVFDTGKKTTIKETIKLLGEGEFKIKDNSFQITYIVEEKYGWNIDSEGGTILKLEFDRDSIFQHWRIEEFWYEP